MNPSSDNTGTTPPSSSHPVVRFVIQWVLPAAALAVACLAFRTSVVQTLALTGLFSFGSHPDDGTAFCASQEPRNLSPDQRLILKGDRSRETPLDREKAIWEKWPTNLVYLHHYITHLAASRPYHESAGETNGDGRGRFAAEITQFQSMDPDNARMDYLLAGSLLDQAIRNQTAHTNADGSVTNRWSMKVVDRAKLDQAMTRFKTGLGKPRYRRYAGEMVTERLAIMGEPTTLLQQIAEIGMVAGTLCPDLATLRQLGRTSMAYAQLLIEEGRTQEARELLSACRQFVPQINDDAYTLIDILVVGAVAGIMAEQVPAAYERLGDAITARESAVETAALAQPIRAWKTRRAQGTSQDTEAEEMIHRHGGVLAGLLLPALGEYPTVAELAPSRLLEYTAIERGALGAASAGLAALMVCCALLAFYYRLVGGRDPASPCRLPHGRDWARFAMWAVVVPLLCYGLVTRCVPWSSRHLSPAIAPHFIAQLLACFLVIVAAVTVTVSRWARQAIRDAALPDSPPVPLFWRTGGLLFVGFPVLLAILPEAWLTSDNLPGPAAAAVIGGAWALFGLAYLVYGLVRRRWLGRTYAACYRTYARTLVPALALAILVLNGIAQPALLREERHWLSVDTVMRLDRHGGFTVIEARLVKRLKGEMQQAAERLPGVRGGAGTLPDRHVVPLPSP